MQTALSTSPNAAIPPGLLKKPALDSTAITGHAAGILYVAPDGSVLLLKRADDGGNFGHHWALPGGGVEDGETPEIGAARESKEEMGIDVDPAALKPLDKVATPTGMAFHTYATPAATKFCPVLNDEHEGYGWFPLDKLPRPMHPAVRAMIGNKIGLGTDADLAEFESARDGFMAWLASDVEVEDPGDDGVSGDSALIAMDRDSVREKTRDGRLIVKRTHISKANVCPYRGKEIPGWQALGLDPEEIYNLLRDPEELRKAAPTLNGVQLLIKHIRVSAEDHRPNETVGSLGTDAEFDGEYLDNSLFVNSKDAIDAIESGRQQELSAGYHYKPDMTPGNFRGSAYDGVMRDIVFNHVALVENGRAGPGVVVGDEALKENDMAKATRFGAMTLSIVAGTIAPLLAMDATLPKDLFSPLTTKNFKDKRAALLAGVRKSVDGKLRSGLALDASMEQLAKAVDAFTDDLQNGVDESAPDDKAAEFDKVAEVTAPEPVKAASETGSTYDAEPMKAFMKQCGMDDDMVAKCMDMMPKPALDADESDEDKKAREEKEAAEKTAKDAEMKDMVTKPAMDAAIKVAVDSATKAVRDNERGIRVALGEVKPYVGELPASMAFDSAEAVYRHVLKMKNVADADKLHFDALLPVLRTLAPAGAKPAAPVIAMDESSYAKAVKMAPGIENIQTI